MTECGSCGEYNGTIHEGFNIDFITKSGCQIFYPTSLNNVTLKVIGNIYENPELLKISE